MNKNLVAVAVAGALAAPGLALAQATTSGTNVQIYGLFDLRLDRIRYSEDTAGLRSRLSKEHLSTGAPNRIGFRGTESLGGGLTAFFQVETAVFTDARADTGSGAQSNATLGGRPTFVGMRGSWGEVAGGNMESVYKDAYQVWSVIPDDGHFGEIMGNGNTSGTMPTPNCAPGFATGTNALVAVGTVVCSQGEGNATSFNRTIHDAITYRSAVISGFRFGAQMAVREFKEPAITTVAGSTGTAAGAGQFNASFGAYSLTWAGGPFSAVLAYEVHNGFRAAGPAVTGVNRSAKDTGVSLGGRWNYGRGLIGAGWERLKYANATTAAADNSFTLKNWVLNGTFNLTASDVIYAGYSKTGGATSCGAGLTAAALTCGSATAAKKYTLGIDHSFSKRTAVYALYAKFDNNAGAAYNYKSDGRTTQNGAGSASGLIAGQDSTAYAVGIKHTF